MTSNNNTLLNQTCGVGALELPFLLGEFVDVDFKRSRFTMKWNESESEVVYSDPAIQRSTCLSPIVGGRGGRGGGRQAVEKSGAEIQTVD